MNISCISSIIVRWKRYTGYRMNTSWNMQLQAAPIQTTGETGYKTQTDQHPGTPALTFTVTLLHTFHIRTCPTPPTNPVPKCKELQSIILAFRWHLQEKNYQPAFLITDENYSRNFWNLTDVRTEGYCKYYAFTWAKGKVAAQRQSQKSFFTWTPHISCNSLSDSNTQSSQLRTLHVWEQPQSPLGPILNTGLMKP